MLLQNPARHEGLTEKNLTRCHSPCGILILEVDITIEYRTEVCLQIYCPGLHILEYVIMTNILLSRRSYQNKLECPFRARITPMGVPTGCT